MWRLEAARHVHNMSTNKQATSALVYNTGAHKTRSTHKRYTHAPVSPCDMRDHRPPLGRPSRELRVPPAAEPKGWGLMLSLHSFIHSWHSTTQNGTEWQHGTKHSRASKELAHIRMLAGNEQAGNSWLSVPSTARTCASPHNMPSCPSSLKVKGGAKAPAAVH